MVLAGSSQREIVEECLKWTSQRKVFGKLLNKQAVIRSKLAQMIQYAESMQNWLENITYQMNNMVDTVDIIHTVDLKVFSAAPVI